MVDGIAFIAQCVTLFRNNNDLPNDGVCPKHTSAQNR